jgi:hypothetical protein
MIKNHANLAQMVEEGNVIFRTPNIVFDHRKLFLLKADDGRTRVIKRVCQYEP